MNIDVHNKLIRSDLPTKTYSPRTTLITNKVSKRKLVRISQIHGQQIEFGQLVS